MVVVRFAPSIQVLMDVLGAVHGAAFEHVHHVASTQLQEDLADYNAEHLQDIMSSLEVYACELRSACLLDQRQFRLRNALEELAEHSMQLHIHLQAGNAFASIQSLSASAKDCITKVKAELDILANRQDNIAKSILMRCDFTGI